VKDMAPTAPRIANANGAPHRRTKSNSKKRKSFNAGRLDDGLQIFEELFEREFDPVAIRQAAPAQIVADERMAARQKRNPGTPDGIVTVVAEVAHPVRPPHQRRAGTTGAISDAGAVAAPAKADLLRGVSHRTRSECRAQS